MIRFATVEVMRQYGSILENFHQNSEELNDSVFTMMHHVSGDLNSPEALFIPQVCNQSLDSFITFRQQNTLANQSIMILPTTLKMLKSRGFDIFTNK